MRSIDSTSTGSVAGGGALEHLRRGLSAALMVVVQATFVASVLLVAPIAVAPIAAANQSAGLDQCANGSLASPDLTPCQSGPEWVNGNLGASKSHYAEGDSIPYRIVMGNLSTGSTVHTITIEWDTTKSGKHATDYLTTYNRTVPASPCAGVAGCSTFDTEPIPADPQVTGAGVTPVAGVFTLFGGTITGLSAYSYPDGTGFVGDKSAQITISFTAAVANPVLAWGGHIATRADWGLGNSAVNISGSPYHERLIDLDGSGGNQDRSLSAEAVLFPGSITIIKQATPESSQTFAYTASPAPLAAFNLVDDGTSANTKLFSDIKNFTTYTITETVPSGWTQGFTTPACTVTSANGGTQGTSGAQLTINLKEGENVTCTYTNVRQPAHLTVIKHVINNNGGTKTAADFTMNVTATNPSLASFPGAESPGTTITVDPGSYSVDESAVSGYTKTIGAGCSGTLAAGGSATCTITNNDQAATLIVIKHVVNDNGGTKTAADFTMSVTGTNASPASFAGAESPGTTVTLDAGSYSVSESAVTGYTSDGGSADCAGTIALGETKTCTFTNNDQAATLIVIKHVVNDNGGTAVAGDFTLDSGGANDTPDNFAGAEAPGTSVTLDAGSYGVTESGPGGYTRSDSADCSGTIANGETKTCTVTNNDIPQGSQITPTATTCQSFRDGTSATLSQLNYSVKAGKISQVDPGVFFYWNRVSAVSGSNTFTITQTITTANFDSNFFNVASGSFVFTTDCVKVDGATITQNGAVTTITFNVSAAATIIIGVKYDSGSVKGKNAPSPTTVHYDFSMGLPGSLSGLDLVKK